MIGVAILGSTGSIGESTLDVVARHADRYRLVAIGANRNVKKLAEQIARYRPAYAALADMQQMLPVVLAIAGASLLFFPSLALTL